MRSMEKVVRKDLIDEFGVPGNASYLHVARVLIQARSWLAEAPDNKDQALCLMRHEWFDRQRRLASINRLEPK